MYHDCEKSDFTEIRYYRINRILLSSIKLWPYEQSMLTSIERLFIFIVLLSFIFFQLTTFLTCQYNLEFFIVVLSYALPCSLCTINYYLFHINSNNIKQVWENINNSWTKLKDETECNIMQRYSRIGELYTISLAVFLLVSFVLDVLFHLSSTILDIIVPLNETRLHQLHGLTEYFVDKETYYYPMLCHWIIGVFLNCYILVVMGTFQIMYMEHICGLFKIACYRIEYSINEYIMHKSPKKSCTAHYPLSAAVDMHRDALKNADFVMKAFMSNAVVMLVLGMTSLTLNLFRLIRAIMLMANLKTSFVMTLLITGHFIVLFTANYFGQQVTDHSNEIFTTAYNVQWYTVPIRIQKLLLFIMKKAIKKYTFNIANIMACSLEDFARFMSVSISYFMVLLTLIK